MLSVDSHDEGKIGPGSARPAKPKGIAQGISRKHQHTDRNVHFNKSFERGGCGNTEKDNDMPDDHREPREGLPQLVRTILLMIASSVPVTMSAPALAQGANPLLPQSLSPWGMFLNADIIVKAVMIALTIASLMTWTIWLAKTIELRLATRRVRQRLKLLESGSRLTEAVRACNGDYDAVAQLVLSTGREAELSDGIVDEGFRERVALRLERVEAAIARQVSRGVSILATIGAIAPFVGLFGTVWGIMNSFIGISEAHTTNLAVVAPGIAEALLTTATGLVAAIPAVVIYNHLARAIAGYKSLLGDASAQLLLMISRGHRAAPARLRTAK